MRAVRTVAAALVLSALCLACCYFPAATGGTPSGGGSAPPPAPATPTLRRLETQLTTGIVYGPTPETLALATAIARYPLDPSDGIVVERVGGAVPHLDVLVELYDDGHDALPDLDDTARRALLNRIAEQVRASWPGGGYHLCIAVRGAVFFGAMLEQAPGVAPVYTTEFSIDEAAIERCLAGP